MKSNENICYKLNFILFFALLIFSFQIRGILFDGNLKSFNFIAFISIILLFLYYARANIFCILILMFASIMMFLSQYDNSKGLFETIVVFSCIILPNFLIFVNIPKDKFIDIFRLYMNIFNIIVIFLIVFAVIDKFTNASIAKFLASILNDSNFYKSVLSDAKNRFYSFMGHPLYNTQIFIMFYIINFCGKKYIKHGINMIIVSIITILGVSLCASKTGLVLLLLCLMLLKPIDNKWIYPIIFLLMIYTAINLGLFDMVIYRFSTQTLTSGRNEMWEILKEYNLFPIKFWTGYGSGFNNIYNQYITLASAAFEYPIRLFALEYGILFSILIYIIIFIIPIFKLLKNRHYILLISFGIVFIDVNTYNGIGLGIDTMLMFSVFVYMIINLSNYLKKNEIAKGD